MSENTTTIHFVRHGLVHNPEGIFYGRKPGFRISETDKPRILALGGKLSAFQPDAVYASPLLRTRQTARLLMEGMGYQGRLKRSRYLLEVFTPYDGYSLQELDDIHWDLYTNSKPPYEQPVDVVERLQHFVKTIRARHSGKDVVAVTHADVILFFLLWVKGYSVSFEGKHLVETGKLPIQFPATASRTSFSWTGNADVPVVEYDPNEGS